MSLKLVNNDNDIEREACAWLAKMDNPQFGDDDRAALKAWILKDTQHRIVFERVSKQFMEVRDTLSIVQVLI